MMRCCVLLALLASCLATPLSAQSLLENLGKPVTSKAMKPAEVGVSTGGRQMTVTDQPPPSRQSGEDPFPRMPNGTAYKPIKEGFDPANPRAIVGNTVVMCPYKTEAECKRYGEELAAEQSKAKTSTNKQKAATKSPVTTTPAAQQKDAPKVQQRAAPAGQAPPATATIAPTATTPLPDYVPPTSTFANPPSRLSLADCRKLDEPFEEETMAANRSGKWERHVEINRRRMNTLPNECRVLLYGDAKSQADLDRTLQGIARSMQKPTTEQKTNPRATSARSSVDCRALHAQATQALIGGQMGPEQAQAIQSRLNAQCGSAYAR
jgi:hypothetical protein